MPAPVRRQSGGASWPEPPLLNAWISKAQSARALLQLHAQHGERMDAMHLGNLWNKLGRHLKWQTASGEMGDSLAGLAAATQSQLEAHVCRRPDILANIAHGAAQAMGADAPAARGLFDAIARAAADACAKPRCEPRHLANLAWAFATASQPQPALFDRIAAASAPLLGGSFNAQEIGMLALEHGGATAALAEATVGLRALKRLARAARRRMAAFNAQDLDSLASAYARLGLPRWGAKLASAIAAAAVALGTKRCTPRHLANVLWGVAKLLARGSVATEPSVVSLCGMAGGAIASDAAAFNARDLSNAAWSLLTLGLFDRPTMLAIAARAAATLDSFNAQETSKLLPREQRLELPLAGPPILLTHMLGGGRAKGAEARRRAARRGAFSEACRGLLIGGREETGATAATGGALWEGSLLLAKWGGAGGEAGRVGGWAGAVQEPSGRPPVGVGPVPVGWAGRSAVELGAGLGLPAIVAGRLGMRTVATDADEDKLGLGRPPDVLLAVDVVYGREERVWSALVETLVALSCEGTLVLMAHGNGAAPGVHSMGGRFYEMAADHFEAASLPADAEHPGCQIHCLVRRPPAESRRGSVRPRTKRARPH
ncbi:hypothetical protein EMIHUDRAFT_240006 [Emiliania huxleyi CCMP1516]|uniref:Uncharacterized protein n=2 Tax=Emiliania huxleyi TaxID=2903 RepID=A0A0D3JGN0_EMIH1|nr:hypothetical protein EMIHUDRAFT_240006 [Emiliania huxleyi CCMP1516]EOD22665.1 hypothetical protein EMIHUDRAFT_240006 [Emiliania huxleyi CCMP1516]|eukprot:XP_005775094.1 hypothetical protein EMIHUDRAFT_240006 [Emiliania huxleyi CCMP1516]